MSEDSGRDGDDSGVAVRSNDGSERLGEATGRAESGALDDVDYERFGKLGGGVYLVVGLGAALTMFLYVLLGSPSVVGPSTVGGAELYIGVANAFSFVVQSSPLVAAALGVYVASLDHDASATVTAAVTTAIGSAVTLVVLAILLVLFEPSGVSTSLGDTLVAIVGAVIGNAATGAGGAYLVDYAPDL